MTREEAIKILDPETRFDYLTEIEYYAGFSGRAAMFAALQEAGRVAIAALREQCNLATNLQPEANSCKWISVEERLPDTYKNVLFCKDRDIRIGYYLGATYSKGVAAFRDLRSAFAFGATHWMPLPEPPKGEQT